MSNSTSFSVTGIQENRFSRSFIQIEKLISLTGILVAKFGPTLIKYSLIFLLISVGSLIKSDQVARVLICSCLLLHLVDSFDRLKLLLYSLNSLS